MKFENNREDIGKFISLCSIKGEVRVVLEPTGGYERHLLRELFGSGISVSIVNPYYVRNFAKSKKDLAKTDKIDARVLADYGEKMNPKIHKRKDEYRFELEDLNGRRDNLIDAMKEEKLRLEKNPEHAICESISKHMDFLETEIKLMEGKISELIASNASKEAEVLMSEKGIDQQTAAILIGSLPELGVLDNRKITKLVGLAPMTRESGKMSSERHIRGGRSRVRRALFMASISAIRSNSKVKDFYKRLRNNGKNAFVALTAVAHKLLVILNSKMTLQRR